LSVSRFTMLRLLIAAALCAAASAAVSKECNTCMEMEATGDGADFFNNMMEMAKNMDEEQAKTMTSCDSPVKVQCENADDTCKGGQASIGLSGDMMGTTLDMDLDITMQGCLPKGVTCENAQQELTKGMKDQGLKVELKKCTLDGDAPAGSAEGDSSSSPALFSISLISLTLPLLL